jgi:hypothetical protein
MAMEMQFKATFPGALWASPLYLENGPHGKGVFFVVTTSNNVYAFDATTGALAWMHNLGSSPTANGGSPTCGSIHPLGILGTPVIDPAGTTLYVAGAIGTTSIMRHEVHALSITDGSEKTGWPVNASLATSGSITFDTVHENQRGALSLIGTTLYVPYGGHIGDCGNYHGWVIGIDTTNPTNRGALGDGGVERIWAPGGTHRRQRGFASTEPRARLGRLRHRAAGRSSGSPARHLVGDAVLPVPLARDGHADADMTPARFHVSSLRPVEMVIQVSKDGHLYIPDAANWQPGRIQVDFRCRACDVDSTTRPKARRQGRIMRRPTLVQLSAGAAAAWK